MENNIASKCLKCGKEFTCEISAGKSSCWCFSFPNVIPIDGEDCLCLDCLLQAIDHQQSSRTIDRIPIS